MYTNNKHSMRPMRPKNTSILFALLAIFAWKHKLALDTVLLGTLAFLSYMNHSKLIPLPIMFHVMDKLYAHIFAITYAITSTWYTFTTRNMLFILSLAIGLISSAVYYFKLLPHVCVHIGVFVAGVVYILALSQVKSNNKNNIVHIQKV